MMLKTNANKRKDKGAVLLTTLLVMSLMSALAVAMMDDIRFAIKRAGNIQAHAQADWYVKAAEDFAVSYLKENFLSLKPSEQNAALKNPIQSALPLEGGVMRLTIMDGSQCFPLSSLQGAEPESDTSFDGGDETELDGEQVDDSDQGSSDKAPEIFTNLLINLEIPDLEAGNLTAAIIDWQDSDQQMVSNGAEDYTYLALSPPYRTSNAPFLSVSELRAVRGMNEEMLKIISPYICAGDADRKEPKVNINTLGPQHLPLLSAMVSNDDDYAAEILQARPGDGYEDIVADLTAKEIDAAKAPNDELFYQPNYLWLEADIDFGLARRTVLLEFRIDSGEATRTYRHYGTEGRRPVKVAAVEEEEQAR